MDGCLHDDPLALTAKVEEENLDGFLFLRYFCGICDTPLGKHEPMIRDHLHREYAMASDQIPMQRIEDLPGYDKAPFAVNYVPAMNALAESVLSDPTTGVLADEVTPFSKVSTGRKWNREQGRFWPTYTSAFNRKR